jgi:hypothetical protein
MAVNGVEIEVGQKWRTRGGRVAEVIGEDDHPNYPINYCVEGSIHRSCGRNGREDGDVDRGDFPSEEGPNDLVELIEYADGFKPWAGGEQPTETIGKLVEYRMRDEPELHTDLATVLRWNHAGLPSDIIAYKVVEEAQQAVEFAGEEPADADALASETLQSLGYHFDGQCWVQDAPSAELPKSALDVQEGGNHYKTLGIQPVEYIQKNNLDYFQGNVVKYVTRHKSKNGAEDVKKALHYCQLILELQYGKAV